MKEKFLILSLVTFIVGISFLALTFYTFYFLTEQKIRKAVYYLALWNFCNFIPIYKRIIIDCSINLLLIKRWLNIVTVKHIMINFNTKIKILEKSVKNFQKFCKKRVKTLYKNFLMMYIILVERKRVDQRRHKVRFYKKCSSFSPLSYIIQEAVNVVNCFLNFKNKTDSFSSTKALRSTSPSRGEGSKVVQEAVKVVNCFLNFKNKTAFSQGVKNFLG